MTLILPVKNSITVASADPVSQAGFNGGTAFVDYFGSMGVYERSILVGQGSATLVDPALWALSQTSGGTVTDGNLAINVQSGTNVAGAAALQSIQVAVLQLGSLNLFSSFVGFASGAPPNNSTSAFGVMTAKDGVGFQWKNGRFGLISRVGNVELRITQFNGTPDFIPDYTVPANWSILYSAGGAIFYCNSTKIHTYVGPIGTSSSLPMRFETKNTGNTTNVWLQSYGAAIARLGPAEVRPTSVFLNAAGTTVVKHGGGTLVRVVVGYGATLGKVTLYDNTVATGTPLAVLDATVANEFTFDRDLATGLTVVLAAAPSVTVLFA